MKIFLSHSANTSVSALLTLLHEEDAVIRGSFELPPGPNPMESIRTEIHSSDAVIVVLDSETSNVLFELGIAFGLRKPTLVLVKPGDSVHSLRCLYSLPDLYGLGDRDFEAGGRRFFGHRTPPQTNEICRAPKTADVTGDVEPAPHFD